MCRDVAHLVIKVRSRGVSMPAIGRVAPLRLPLPGNSRAGSPLSSLFSGPSEPLPAGIGFI